MESENRWIYFLKLSKDLPEFYLNLDQNFKRFDKSLVPITLKSLVESVKRNDEIHLVVVIRSFREFEYFNKKVRKMLKYIVRQERVNIYMASSFSSVNDPSIMRKDFYNYIKLPVDMNLYCESVATMIEVKNLKLKKWPGGMRPRMSLVS
jgi:hypothetical protein